MDIKDIFASMVFTEETMQKYIGKEVFSAWKKCVNNGGSLAPDVADAIAKAMCTWAIEKGATHYTHWFQPMTGFTAEKHDSFLVPAGKGKVITELSGKELSKGETDASALPSGGLRATFEARGYTAWDITSYAFIKDKTLYIPTFFCSYSGEVLDKKTPLLRSVAALDKECRRIMKLLGENVKHVLPQVGPEQEYFLIDKEYFDARPDLKLCGRTLFGSKPPKGQELDDHYYGAIKPQVQKFMQELDEELWKLGVYAKTEHNEAAPCQHEMAPVFTDVNTACDHNQITMELLKRIAQDNGMECVLSEKPFAGVNGSGKHNNWSLLTDKGENLLLPGNTPSQNARFLVFLAAFIAGVDDYQEMLRCCVAYRGNDFRLGGNEAPPVILSVSLGDELTAVVDSIISGQAHEDKKKKILKIGVDSIPEIPVDTADRNRTAPIAFTGNKFEFRMLGASQSIAGPNVVINTMVAEELSKISDALSAEDADLNKILSETFKKHRRIIFNGNCYSDSWEKEAKERGLSSLRNTVSSMPQYIDEKNVALFSKHGVYSKAEMEARYAIHLEEYCKKTAIEGRTLIEMFIRHILPAVSEYETMLCTAIEKKEKQNFKAKSERRIVAKIDKCFEDANLLCDKLKDSLDDVSMDTIGIDTAELFNETISDYVAKLGEKISELEELVAADFWPYPTYEDILF